MSYVLKLSAELREVFDEGKMRQLDECGAEMKEKVAETFAQSVENVLRQGLSETARVEVSAALVKEGE